MPMTPARNQRIMAIESNRKWAESMVIGMQII